MDRLNKSFNCLRYDRFFINNFDKLRLGIEYWLRSHDSISNDSEEARQWGKPLPITFGYRSYIDSALTFYRDFGTKHGVTPICVI